MGTRSELTDPPFRGMAHGMAKKKVTITLEPEQVESIERLVSVGKAQSLSGFIQHAVAVSLADVAGWGVMLSQALARTGGALTREERSWADSILTSRSRVPRKGKRRAA